MNCNEPSLLRLLPALREGMKGDACGPVLCPPEEAGQEDFCIRMDAPFGNAGCIIMASGMGRRFGGNKLMAPFGGRHMICRALKATQGIFARRVVVTRHADVAALCRERGIDVLLHDLPLRSDAIRLGLEALGEVSSCMFCPGDQPLLRRDTVAALALAAADDASCIWRAAWEGRPGSPVLFPAWAFDELRSLPAGKGGGYVAARHADALRLLAVQDPHELMDVDTPADLEHLLGLCPDREDGYD